VPDPRSFGANCLDDRQISRPPQNSSAVAAWPSAGPCGRVLLYRAPGRQTPLLPAGMGRDAVRRADDRARRSPPSRAVGIPFGQHAVDLRCATARYSMPPARLIRQSGRPSRPAPRTGSAADGSAAVVGQRRRAVCGMTQVLHRRGGGQELTHRSMAVRWPAAPPGAVRSVPAHWRRGQAKSCSVPGPGCVEGPAREDCAPWRRGRPWSPGSRAAGFGARR
jgi:hypothetical protein